MCRVHVFSNLHFQELETILRLSLSEYRQDMRDASVISDLLELLGFNERIVDGDGNCLFRSLFDQWRGDWTITSADDENDHLTVRFLCL